MFYPDIKKHISPSAMATWHNSRAGFIKSYFKGEKSPETPAMKAGTKIHGLIEAGFLDTHKKFELNEKELVIPVRNTTVVVLGKPDSYGKQDSLGFFVDYKSGGDVSWTREDLAKDMKMRATAWLVWKELGEPEEVHGYIAWIATRWNGTELVPVNDEYMMLKYIYYGDELYKFEEVIEKTINDVNVAYDKFLASVGSVSVVDTELCKKYVMITDQIKNIETSVLAPLEAQLDELRETIAEQMAFTDLDSHDTGAGSFFWKTTKKYTYPDNLEFQLEDGEVMNWGRGEQVALAMSVVKKNYEASSEPVEVKKTLQFKPSKAKK